MKLLQLIVLVIFFLLGLPLIFLLMLGMVTGLASVVIPVAIIWIIIAIANSSDKKKLT